MAKEPKKVIDRSELTFFSDYGRISKNITQVILTSKQEGLSINGIRSILVIITALKNKQLFKKEQLSLFDKDFGDITKTNDSTVQFCFYWKDFLPEGSKNYKKAEEGLVELTTYGGRHSFVNEEGSPIRIYSSIISDLTVNEKQKGVRFNMNIAWYRLFLEITNYNKFSNKVIFEISSVNAMTWYFFLKTLPLNTGSGKPIDTYKFSMQNINEKFNTDYTYWGKIKEKLLDPIRKTLNQKADISFNYKIEKDILYVTTYALSPAVPVTYENEDELKTARTVKYQRKKYDLTPEDCIILNSLYKKYSYDDVYKAINRQKSLSKLLGRKYVEEVGKLIIIYLSNKN